MNGLNRNCVWSALDKPEYRASLWDWLTAALAVAAFIALLWLAGEAEPSAFIVGSVPK